MKFYYQDSLITPAEIEAQGKNLLGYIGHLNIVAQKGDYDEWEGAINLPTDEKILEEVQKVVAQKVGPQLKWIVVVGIGGSNLGTKAVYDALLGRDDLIEPDRFPKIIFLDAIDEKFNTHFKKFLQNKISSSSEILVNLVSESGETVETLTNFSLLSEYIDQTIITTDLDSVLWEMAQEKNVSVLCVPPKVAGRYSILSPVGLFPLLCAGLNIKALRDGAMSGLKVCLCGQVLENPALVSAVILQSMFKSGKNINDNFFFCPELESLGKWYRQLLAESIGKKEDIGITPTISIGSTDLHSVGQLYLGGPKDKITTFVTLAETNEVNGAIFSGVKKSYLERGLPFMHVVLDDLDEKSLGQFFQFKMIEVMLLGKLFDVNPFDQPAVEAYKNEARHLLS